MNDIGERQLQPGAIVPRMLPRYAHDSQAAQQIAALTEASRWRDVAEPAPSDEEAYDQQWQAPPWGAGMWDAYSDPAIFPQAGPLDEFDGADAQPELPPAQPGAVPSGVRAEEIGGPGSRAPAVAPAAAEPVGARTAEAEAQTPAAQVMAPDHGGQPVVSDTVQADGGTSDASPALPASRRANAATAHLPDIMPEPIVEPPFPVAASVPQGVDAPRAGVADHASTAVAALPRSFATAAATAPQRPTEGAATPGFVRAPAPLAATGFLPGGVDSASVTPLSDPILQQTGQVLTGADVAPQPLPATPTATEKVGDPMPATGANAGGVEAASRAPGAEHSGTAISPQAGHFDMRADAAPQLAPADGSRRQSAAGSAAASRPIAPAAGESLLPNAPLPASEAVAGRPLPATDSMPGRVATASPLHMPAGGAPQALSIGASEVPALGDLSATPVRPAAPADTEAQLASTQMSAPDVVVAPLIAPSFLNAAVSSQPVQLKAAVAAPALAVPVQTGPALPSQAAATSIPGQAPAMAPTGLQESADLATDPNAGTTNTVAATVAAEWGVDSVVASTSAAAPIYPAPAIEFEGERKTAGVPPVAEEDAPQYTAGPTREPTAAVQSPSGSYALPTAASSSAQNAAQATVRTAIRTADTDRPVAQIERFASKPGGEQHAVGESGMHSISPGAAKAVPLDGPHRAPPEVTTVSPSGATIRALNGPTPAVAPSAAAPLVTATSPPSADVAPHANAARTNAEPYVASTEGEARRPPAQAAPAHDAQHPPLQPAMSRAVARTLPVGSPPLPIGVAQVAALETHPVAPSNALPANEAPGRPHPPVQKESPRRSDGIDTRPAAATVLAARSDQPGQPAPASGANLPSPTRSATDHGAASLAREQKARPARPLDDLVPGRGIPDSIATRAIAAARRQAAAAESDLAARVAQAPTTKRAAPSQAHQSIAPAAVKAAQSTPAGVRSAALDTAAPSRQANWITPPAARSLAAASRQIAPQASGAHAAVASPINYRPVQVSAKRLNAASTLGAMSGQRSKVATPALSLAAPAAHGAVPIHAPALQSPPGPRLRAISPVAMARTAASRADETSAPGAPVRGGAAALRAVPARASREPDSVSVANGHTPAPAKSAAERSITPQPTAPDLPRRTSANQDTPVTVRVNIGRIRIEGAPAKTQPQARSFRRPAPALTLVQYAQRRSGRRP